VAITTISSAGLSRQLLKVSLLPGSAKVFILCYWFPPGTSFYPAYSLVCLPCGPCASLTRGHYEYADFWVWSDGRRPILRPPS